jgi:hypothetical protein
VDSGRGLTPGALARSTAGIITARKPHFRNENPIKVNVSLCLIEHYTMKAYGGVDI